MTEHFALETSDHEQHYSVEAADHPIMVQKIRASGTQLLFVAINEAKALFAGGYRAPHKRLFPVAGRSGVATITAQLVNMRDGGFISAHDFHIAGLIAGVLTGGEVDGENIPEADEDGVISCSVAG